MVYLVFQNLSWVKLLQLKHFNAHFPQKMLKIQTNNLNKSTKTLIITPPLGLWSTLYYYILLICYKYPL